jgi:translation elongation factor EF-G
MDLFSALVPVEVVVPVDHCGDVIGELNRVGGVIEGLDNSDRARVRARIPAAALKTLEMWVSTRFGGRGEIALLPIVEGDI